MSVFSFTVIGSGSAVYSNGLRHQSFWIANDNQAVMLDCGEGTQYAINDYGLRTRKLNNIVISHMHADHYLGLPGLLLSMSLVGRKNPINVYGPIELLDYLRFSLKTAGGLNYLVNYFTYEQLLAHSDVGDFPFVVQTYDLDHSLPSKAFRFTERKYPRHIIAQNIPSNTLNAENYDDLRRGLDVVLADGTLIKSDIVTEEATPARVISVVCDTRYVPHVAEFVSGSDILFHEATFLDSEAEMAQQTGHSTATQAAKIALDSKSKMLLIGHFSARYNGFKMQIAEAQQVFANTHPAEQGKTYLA